MAFANFMVPNSYSNLQDIAFCKQQKRISFALVVYNSDQKVSEIATVHYSKYIGVNMTQEQWDEFFAMSKITGDSDLLKQIYLFLKSQPEFASVQDV